MERESWQRVEAVGNQKKRPQEDGDRKIIRSVRIASPSACDSNILTPYESCF